VRHGADRPPDERSLDGFGRLRDTADSLRRASLAARSGDVGGSTPFESADRWR
jgi:hypothetical protein